MDLTPLNLGLVLGFLLILLALLGIVIFRVCKQEPHDVVFPKHSTDLHHMEQNLSESSLKPLEVDDLGLKCEYLNEKNILLI